VSVAAIYHPVNGALAEVAGSGGVSPVDAPLSERKEGSRTRRWLVPHHHLRGVRLKPGTSAVALAAVIAALCGGPAGCGRGGSAPMLWSGTPSRNSLTGAPGDFRPREGDRDQPADRSLPPVSLGAAAGGEVSGDHRPGSRRGRVAAFGGRAAACISLTSRHFNPDTIMPSYYRLDGLERVGAGVSRQDRALRRSRSRTLWPSQDVARREEEPMKRHRPTRRAILAGAGCRRCCRRARRSAAHRPARHGDRPKRCRPRSRPWSARRRSTKGGSPSTFRRSSRTATPSLLR